MVAEIWASVISSFVDQLVPLNTKNIAKEPYSCLKAIIVIECIFNLEQNMTLIT